MSSRLFILLVLFSESLFSAQSTLRCAMGYRFLSGGEVSIANAISTYEQIWTELGSHITPNDFKKMIENGSPFVLPEQIQSQSESLKNTLADFEALIQISQIDQGQVKQALLNHLSKRSNSQGQTEAKQVEILRRDLKLVAEVNWKAKIRSAVLSPDGQLLIAPVARGAGYGHPKIEQVLVWDSIGNDIDNPNTSYAPQQNPVFAGNGKRVYMHLDLGWPDSISLSGNDIYKRDNGSSVVTSTNGQYGSVKTDITKFKSKKSSKAVNKILIVNETGDGVLGTASDNYLAEFNIQGEESKGRLISLFAKKKGLIKGLAYLSDNRKVVFQGSSLFIIDAEGTKVLQEIAVSEKGEVSDFKISKDQNTLFTLRKDTGGIDIWSFSEGKYLRSLPFPNERKTQGIQISGIDTVGDLLIANVWDANQGETKLWTFNASKNNSTVLEYDTLIPNQLRGLTISKNGKRFALTNTRTKKSFIWELPL